jgi:hypothetical protein
MISENNELKLGRVQRLYLKVDLRGQTVSPFASCRNKQLIASNLAASTATYLFPIQSAFAQASLRVHQVIANVKKAFRNNNTGSTSYLGIFIHPMDDGLGPLGVIDTYLCKSQLSGTNAPLVASQQAPTNVVNMAYSTYNWATGPASLSTTICARRCVIEIVYREGASL